MKRLIVAALVRDTLLRKRRSGARMAVNKRPTVRNNGQEHAQKLRTFRFHFHRV